MADPSMSEVDDIMAELGLSPAPKSYDNQIPMSNNDYDRSRSSSTVVAQDGSVTEVDSLMSELGLTGSFMQNDNTPVKKSAGPGIRPGFSGPGKMAMSGPGKMAMSGPGKKSAGPGAGPHGIGRGKPMATHTPDGRPIIYTGPPCGNCGEMVIGVCLNALGKSYHGDCFVCNHCNKPFPGGAFVEHEGNPYCETDYNQLFCARCQVCQTPITDKCVNAAGKKFHPEHFACSGCGENLVGKTWKEEEGDIYCTVCKESRKQRIAPATEICAKCKRPIIGEYVTLHGQKMHPEHFRCFECGCEFKGGNCMEFEGNLYCQEDYLKLLRNTCASCHKPILGRSVTALGKVWHPDHFVCFSCHEPFAGSNFYEHDGKPYCEVHFTQNFGTACAKCNRPVVHNAIHFLDKVYHTEHFTCSGCDCLLKKGDITEWEMKPMCQKCYGKLPSEVRKRVEKKREADKKIAEQRKKEEKKAAKNNK